MQLLSPNSTRIFLRLTREMNQFKLIRVEGKKSLYVELIEKLTQTAYGIVKVYYLSQFDKTARLFYPDMSFFFIDKRADIQELDALFILPYTFWGKDAPLEYSAQVLPNGEISPTELGPAHCNFADGWLTQLEEEGFIR
jgi:hypothetical protein